MQDEITKTIVEQLKVKLLPQEKQAIEAAPTQNIDAYNYYLQGRHLYHLHTTPHVLLAQRMFKKAVELDPAYARAYAGLADCAWFSSPTIMKAPPRTRSCVASKALQLDPALAEAHASYGMALHLAGQLAGGGRRSSTRRSSSIRTCTRPSISPLTRAATGATRRAQRACTRERPSLLPTISARQCCGRALLLDLGRPSEFRTAALVGIERAERSLKAHPTFRWQLRWEPPRWPDWASELARSTGPSAR